jgi:DHA2 family methylenomycin A resistance protein-like MFS transporter
MTMARDRNPSDSGIVRALAVGSMCTGMFFILLDVTIVNVALPAIRSGLHTGPSGLLWVVDADTLVFASLLLTGGALGDRFGHKRMVQLGLAVFGLGSLACALSPTIGALVAARAIQGVGGALLLPQTLAVIAAAYPEPARQARVLGVWAGISSAPSADRHERPGRSADPRRHCPPQPPSAPPPQPPLPPPP